MAKIVTANTLATGHVVFLAPDGSWVAAVEAAETWPDAEAAEAGLERARADQARSIIVDPFVTDMTPGEGTGTEGRPAMTLRDTIRAFGPTIRYIPRDAERVS